MTTCSTRGRFVAAAVAALLLCGCGTSGASGGGPASPSAAPTLQSAAPEPTLPAGFDAVPAASPTPMRLTGTALPVIADPTQITVRLTAPTFVFFGGTSTLLETQATASTAASLDFVAPPATLVGVDAVVVSVTVLFPDGSVAALPSAFTYLAPALNVVTTTEAELPGASGIVNPALATGSPVAPVHLFARGGGEPFVLSPAARRTFGPLPVPAAGASLGVVDVVFRTPGTVVWPGGHDFATTTAQLVSNGTFWEIRGTMPGDLTDPGTGGPALDATVTVVFEDGGLQVLPASPAGAGARLVRTTQRVFAVTAGGFVRGFGQSPGVAGVTAAVDGDPSGAGPLALDAERNRLYVANGVFLDVYDTARAADGAPTPAFGARLEAPASPLPVYFTIPGAGIRSVAVDPVSGSIWAVSDLGVHVVNPFVADAPIVTLPVPAGLGATTHADRVVSMAVTGEMLVSLWDGAGGAGTEALLLYHVATRALEGIYPVPAMTATNATIGPNGTSLGNPTQQFANDGTPNGAASQAVCSNVIANNRPAATGAVWNREFAVRPSAGGSPRVYLLFENTGPTTGTIVAANATNASPGGGAASGVAICMPMDWVNTLDLVSGGMTNGLETGAYPLGVNALTGPGAGERGSIAYDATRDEVVVHAATTGGTLFTFQNVSSAFASPPSGPPYTAGSFMLSAPALAAMINVALTSGAAINAPSSSIAAVVPSQEHLRVLTAPGAVTPGGGGVGTISQVPSAPLANPTLGAPRGAAQRTADLVLSDGVAGAPNGNWYLFGAPGAADLTECSFDGTTVTSTTAVGVAPLPAGPAWPTGAATSP